MTLLVGIGNRLRGDDGVGPVVADHVAALGIPGLTVETDLEPVAVLHRLTRPPLHAHVVLLDATAPLGDPGRIQVVRMPGDRLSVPAGPVGSHGLGVAEVLELARALDVLPPRLTVVGVEAEACPLGSALSDTVSRCVPDAVALVTAIVAQQLGTR